MDRNHVLEKLANISSYNRCVRTIAYMLRFVQITHMKRKFETTLSSEELRNASYCIIWNIQHVEDIRQLQKDQPLRSHLKFLNPFLDRSTGFSLIRVGGRLDSVEFENFEKHPILLPSKSHFVWIYVRHLHLRNCHAGPKALVALIRLVYWIVNARDLARRIVRTCMACVRYKPKLERQLMGTPIPTLWYRLLWANKYVCSHTRKGSHKILLGRIHLFGIQGSAHRSGLSIIHEGILGCTQTNGCSASAAH
ncbi:GH23680 [Drosophila grimshawi]|uniref:GH23680 n=1 Tax=Drosophila grimshawi TaxID=7222 RepID=B4K2C8_DROGR|nr:GH23680 [Drosophila grimshawi]